MASKLEVLVKSPDRLDPLQGRELEQVVDEDIMEFNEYFKELGNDPIVRSEVAIIKTYLHWKMRVKKGEQNGSETGS